MTLKLEFLLFFTYLQVASKVTCAEISVLVPPPPTTVAPSPPILVPPPPPTPIPAFPPPIEPPTQVSPPPPMPPFRNIPVPVPPITPSPPVRSTQDCVPLCEGRCALHSRKNICQRACMTCCERCKCVPPGTYGNREKCGKCYSQMKTRRNQFKCP